MALCDTDACFQTLGWMRSSDKRLMALCELGELRASPLGHKQTFSRILPQRPLPVVKQTFSRGEAEEEIRPPVECPLSSKAAAQSNRISRI